MIVMNELFCLVPPPIPIHSPLLLWIQCGTGWMDEFNLAYVTLHVGLGTFRPVKCENILEHKMEPESFQVPFHFVDDVQLLKYRQEEIEKERARVTPPAFIVESAILNKLKNKFITYIFFQKAATTF